MLLLSPPIEKGEGAREGAGEGAREGVGEDSGAGVEAGVGCGEGVALAISNSFIWATIFSSAALSVCCIQNINFVSDSFGLVNKKRRGDEEVGKFFFFFFLVCFVCFVPSIQEERRG